MRLRHGTRSRLSVGACVYLCVYVCWQPQNRLKQDEPTTAADAAAIIKEVHSLSNYPLQSRNPYQIIPIKKTFILSTPI